jgi:predicted lipid-binding transport protein (Tim44 family)
LSPNDSFDPSIIVLAALAVFVVWKLWSVLGVRTERERPAADRFQGQGFGRRMGGPAAAQRPGFSPEPAPLAEDRWKGVAEPGAAWAGLDAIAAADRGFSGETFVEGAKKAYEMVVEAFAKGDRDTLHNLLAKDVFDSFAAEITGREQRGETAQAQVVAMESAKVEDAQLNQRRAQITLRFVVKLVTSRSNRAGEVIEGDATQPIEITDLWTFARDTGSRDPNWKLVATETVH